MGKLLPPATKLGQGNIFRSVCQEFCSRGRRGGGNPACIAGLQAHTQGESWGVWPGGVSRSTPRGRGVEGSGLGGLQAHTQGGLQTHTQGVSRPTPGEGFPGTHLGRYPSMHWGRHPPADSYCCGWYASYWNAFLLRKVSACYPILETS